MLDEEKAAIERYRRMPPEEKIARALDLSELALELKKAGEALRHEKDPR